MASWGGPPRDPYTGSKYRDGARPLFNPGLKARSGILGIVLGDSQMFYSYYFVILHAPYAETPRIDRWLLGREGQDGAVGRTVGGAQAISR